ncbi:MAG: hypothetical protein JNM94_11150 [Phycisphaerae bacterium]|nr:hypothetical protein [Phycisphaerae bacterium]
MHATSTSSVDQNAIVSEIDLPDPAATMSWSAPRWSKDGTRVVVERQVDARAWPWLDDHRADVGPALVLVGLALGFWWLVRTWRRPRQVGRRYCRRCNHDVGGAEAQTERCGECGGVLAGRGTVVGRVRLFRLGPMLALATLLVAGGAFLAYGSIVGSSAQIFGPRTAWPLAALDRFPEWPLWRADVSWTSAKRLDVVAIDADGQLQRIPTSAIELPPNVFWYTSDDGRMLAWSRFDESNGWRQEVCWFDVDANVQGSTFVGSGGDGFLRVCGFTPDGRSIVVRRDGLIGPSARQITAPDGATLGHHAVEVIVVGPRDGSSSTVGTGEAYAIGSGGASWLIEPGLVAVGPGPRTTWATFTLSRPRPPAQSPAVVRIANLVIGNESDSRAIDVVGDLVSFNGTMVATIVDDRELVIEETDVDPLTRVRYRIDLATGNAAKEAAAASSSIESRFGLSIVVPAGISAWRGPGSPAPEWVRLRATRR